MDEPNLTQELLAFFKALSDANRLKIIGLLANKPYPVEQVAALLHLSESTVSHHLTRLANAGLVEGRASGYYTVYHLKTGVLEQMAQRLLSPQTLTNLAEGVELEAFDRKVLHDYLLPDGHLKEIPAQRKKLEVILRHIAQDFESGHIYPEKQVNEMLARYHADTATLRRELIGYKILARESGEYWKPVAG